MGNVNETRKRFARFFNNFPNFSMKIFIETVKESTVILLKFE